MKKKIIIIISFLLMLLLIISVILIYREFNSEKEYRFTPKEDLIKDLEKNYSVFERVGKRVVDQNGYFYAEYIENKLVIETDIQSINNLDIVSKQEFENDIYFIINELNFIGISKDKTNYYVVFDKEENGGGSAIIYSLNGNVPEVGKKELIKPDWYYYIWQGV